MGGSPEFIVKLVMEAGVFGGMAITMLWFLMNRMMKQLDDAEDNRRRDHNQMRLWFAAMSKWMVVVEKHFMLHEATVHGLNSSTGENQDERSSNAEKKFDAIVADLDSATATLDRAMTSMEKEDERRLAAK